VRSSQPSPRQSGGPCLAPVQATSRRQTATSRDRHGDTVARCGVTGAVLTPTWTRRERVETGSEIVTHGHRVWGASSDTTRLGLQLCLSRGFCLYHRRNIPAGTTRERIRYEAQTRVERMPRANQRNLYHWCTCHRTRAVSRAPNGSSGHGCRTASGRVVPQRQRRRRAATANARIRPRQPFLD
jgi:hypothetical protein